MNLIIQNSLVGLAVILALYILLKKFGIIGKKASSKSCGDDGNCSSCN